ncbi:hypothetical protein MZM54_03455 [[Brevibacterium] frigoritolerans]|nr:hypothetical protein [Peribacillus frigoritolerans]
MECLLSKSISYKNIIYRYIEEKELDHKKYFLGKQIIQPEENYTSALSQNHFSVVETNAVEHIALLLEKMSNYESYHFELNWVEFDKVIHSVNEELGFSDEFNCIIDDIREQFANFQTMDTLLVKAKIIKIYLKGSLPEPKIKNFKILATGDVDYLLNKQSFDKEYNFQYLLKSYIKFSFTLLNKEYYMQMDVTHLDYGVDSWQIFIGDTTYRSGLSPKAKVNRENELMFLILQSEMWESLKTAFINKKKSLIPPKPISFTNITPIRRIDDVYVMEVLFNGFVEPYDFEFQMNKSSFPIKMDDFMHYRDPFKMYPGWYIDLVNETTKIIDSIKVRLVK